MYTTYVVNFCDIVINLNVIQFGISDICFICLIRCEYILYVHIRLQEKTTPTTTVKRHTDVLETLNQGQRTQQKSLHLAYYFYQQVMG